MKEGSEVDWAPPSWGGGAGHLEGRAGGGALNLENEEVEVNTLQPQIQKGNKHVPQGPKRKELPLCMLFIWVRAIYKDFLALGG